MSIEVSWFSALCDDDYRYLGVHDPALKSCWSHCRDIVLKAEQNGYDNILLPSGYALGIDSVSFAGGVAALIERMRLLVAVRCGELWVPQLARQLATLDQMLDGRLTINIISSDIPGEKLESGPRYQRTRENMQVLRTLLNGEPVDFAGEHLRLQLDPPGIRTVSGKCPPFYFGGMSEPAREVAAECADVFLMWPDTLPAVESLLADMRRRAESHQRELRFGYRAHVVVRETEGEAVDAANDLLRYLDADEGDAIRNRSLDSASVGVNRQAQLRADAGSDGFAEDHLWTGIGRARSGCGAAIVGDPDQVVAKIGAYQKLGIEAFILSGYPHLEECDLFAKYVLPQLDHSPLSDVAA
ncbi:MAG: LLM class flavin-dependent oxidoreductase [Pseudomonadota bacterium]